MRTQGTLTKWNEAQARGAISPADGGADVEVQMSSMPHDGMRPRLGESLSYEVENDADGRSRAVRVWRVGDRGAVAAAARKRRDGAARTKLAIGLVLLAIVAYALYDRFGMAAAADCATTGCG